MTGDHIPIRIMAIDDDAIVRQGIASLVAGQSDMKMVAEASKKSARKEQRKHSSRELRVTSWTLQEIPTTTWESSPKSRLCVL